MSFTEHRSASSSHPARAFTAESVLSVNDNLPIITHKPVHSGKVRSVYWLSPEDSQRLIEQKNYPVHPSTQLAVMVISDRLSAFDCLWQCEGGLEGVPGKGAALNAISSHWFNRFREQGLANSHIIDIPHPLVWIVRVAQPIKIEAIARRYLTGSLWRSYAKGEREFCGIALPNGLQAHQKLEELLITPSTKGILKGIPNVPEADDVNVRRIDIEQNFADFGFDSADDIAHYEHLLKQGFVCIEEALNGVGQVFVDTKFEFGYSLSADGQREMIYMDEVGTPDSSRMWDADKLHNASERVENSKESFRQALLNHFEDSDVLLDKDRMDERLALAKATQLPAEFFQNVSQTYCGLAEAITGKPLPVSDNPHQEILDALAGYGLVK